MFPTRPDIRDHFGVPLQTGDTVIYARTQASLMTYRKGVIASMHYETDDVWCKVRWDGEDRVRPNAGKITPRNLVRIVQ